MGTEVSLTLSEVMHGATAGVMRKLHGLRANLPPAHDIPEDNHWQIDIEGCLAEMSVAKLLNQYWSGKGLVRGNDVGVTQRVEVRSSPSHGNRLILHPTDNDNCEYWFVTGQYGKYRVHGFIIGADGKRDEFWEDPTGRNRWAYFVPQAALNKAV